MGRALTFLARSGVAAASTVLIISTGVGSSRAAPLAHPADTPVACNSGSPVVATLCDAVISVTDAAIPNGSTTITAPPLPVPDLPIPALPPLLGDGVTVTLPVQTCTNGVGNATTVGDATAGGCVAATPGVSIGANGGLISVSAPVQVCNVAIGAVNGSSAGACPATGPTSTDAGTGSGLVDLAAPIQLCGITLGAINSAASGACPATGPTAVTGTGRGVLNVGIAAQVCGVAVGAVDASAAGVCPATGPTAGGGTSTGPINVTVPIQVCGVSTGTNGGAARSSCPENAPTTTVAATTPSTTPGSTATTASPANDFTATTAAADSGSLANAAPGSDAMESDPTGAGGDGGSGSLPITGISVTLMVLGAGALVELGLVTRRVASRKVHRTVV